MEVGRSVDGCAGRTWSRAISRGSASLAGSAGRGSPGRRVAGRGRRVATVAVPRSKRQPSHSVRWRNERDVREAPAVRPDACPPRCPARIVHDTARRSSGRPGEEPDRVDYGSTFCERCGLDSDRLGSAGASDFRVCPDCSSSNCANCWNQVAGRCLACSPFHLASVPLRTSRRIVPASIKPPVSAGVKPPGVATMPPRRAANGGVSSSESVVARAVAAGDGVATGAGRLARRGLGKIARVALVAVVVLAAVAGVRAVTTAGGAVASQDQVEMLLPATPAASDAGGGAPEATGPAAQQDPSEPPAERHTGSGTTPSSNGGGASGGGPEGGGSSGGGSGGAGGDSSPTPKPSLGPTATPGPRGTPIPTPKPIPTATPAPTPDPGTPTPDPGTPTPDPATPTPDPATPTPDTATPTPEP